MSIFDPTTYHWSKGEKNWHTKYNNALSAIKTFLGVEHNADGTHTASALTPVDFKASGHTPVYISSSSFKVAGLDVSGTYVVGRRLKITLSGGDVYCTVKTVSFSTDTTITTEETTITNTISAVAYGIVSHGSTGSMPKHNHSDDSTGGNLGPMVNALTSKATPVDNDEISLADSAASFALKKLTWANLKAILLTTLGIEPTFVGGVGILRGVKNILINGCCRIYQRGASFTNPGNNTYTLDRWKIEKANGTGTAPSVDVSNDTSQSWSSKATDAIKLAITAVGTASATTKWRIYQLVEDWAYYKGKQVTFSVKVKGSSAITGLFKITIGDGVSETSTTWATMPTSEATYSVTMTLSSSATKLNAYIALMDGDNAISGVANIFITDMQLETGPLATSFERRHYTVDFHFARRYCRKTQYAVGAMQGGGTTATIVIDHPGMRVAPTPSVTAPIAVSDNVSADWTQSSGQISIQVNAANSGRYTAGNFTATGGVFINMLTSGGAILLDAEI